MLLLVAAACGSDPKPPAAPDPNGIELVWPGQPPRQVLRYAVAQGTKTQLQVTVDVDLDAGGQGSPLPRLVVTSELAIEDVRTDGSARVRVTMLDVASTPRDLATVSTRAMTAHMGLMRGIALVGTLRPDGGIRDLQVDATVKLPPGLDQQLAQVQSAFQRISMPLPRVPVGPGAIWRQIKTIDQGGMQLVAATTLSLGSIEGSLVTYTMATSLVGRDQTVTLLGTPIQVKGLGGSGAGKGSLDLARMALTGDATLALHSQMTAAGETDLMQMTVTTRVGPAPAVEATP